MRWNLLKKDKNQYDWVIKYLDDDRKLTAPPYLWTRIRAHINSPEKQKARIPESGLVNLLLPFFLTASVILGIALGKIFADRLQNQLNFVRPSSQELTTNGTAAIYDPYRIIENNFDLEALLEVHNGNN